MCVHMSQFNFRMSLEYGGERRKWINMFIQKKKKKCEMNEGDEADDKRNNIQAIKFLITFSFL